MPSPKVVFLCVLFPISLCGWGSCFWICTSRLGLRLLVLRRLLLPSSTSTLSHSIFHTHLCHNLCHTSLSHTIFHTPSLSHSLSHTIFHLFVTHHLSHTTLSHTIFVTRHLCHTGWVWWRAWGPLVPRTPRHFCVAGVSLGDIHLHVSWEAWRLVTSTFVLHGRRGTSGTGLGLVGRLKPLGGA